MKESIFSPRGGFISHRPTFLAILVPVPTWIHRRAPRLLVLSAAREQGMEITGEGSELPNELVGGRDALKAVVEESTLISVQEDTDR